MSDLGEMSTHQADYDVCVVGAGLIGSAVARHLVESHPSLKVALIGPGEPQSRDHTDIFGAWHDQGRITRVLDEDSTWALLAKRSISNYRHLEEKSGVRFYEEVGYLVFGSANQTLITDLIDSPLLISQNVKKLSSAELSVRFPYLQTGGGEIGLLSEQESGYIQPRALVAAQQQVCRQHGCDIYGDVVEEIFPLEASSWKLKLQSGHSVSSHKVLLAVGAFSSSRALLPGNLQPQMDLLGLTVLLVEVEAEDLPYYRQMPSMFTTAPAQPRQGQENTMSGCYILPPIKYPDGKVYLKIGHSKEMAVTLHTAAEVRSWYRSGCSRQAELWLLNMRACLFPGLKMNDYKFDHCVISQTPAHGLYVDMVAPGFGLVLGDCGCSAKSSDEIGRMAARMILKGEWDYDIPAEIFTFHSQTPPSRM